MADLLERRRRDVILKAMEARVISGRPIRVIVNSKGGRALAVGTLNIRLTAGDVALVLEVDGEARPLAAGQSGFGPGEW